jgi:hypothetical protein
MGMGRSDILTEELRILLLDIELWLKDTYYEGMKIDTDALSGITLQMHNEWIIGITDSLDVIFKVLDKGYYTTDEKEVLNLLRKSWIEEKVAKYKVK